MSTHREPLTTREFTQREERLPTPGTTTIWGGLRYRTAAAGIVVLILLAVALIAYLVVDQSAVHEAANPPAVMAVPPPATQHAPPQPETTTGQGARPLPSGAPTPRTPRP